MRTSQGGKRAPEFSIHLLSLHGRMMSLHVWQCQKKNYKKFSRKGAGGAKKSIQTDELINFLAACLCATSAFAGNVFLHFIRISILTFQRHALVSPIGCCTSAQGQSSATM
jgi:hypothetical protein